MYTPVLEKDTRVMLAGSGHNIYIKEIKIKQTERQEYFKTGGFRQNQYDCCCKVF